MALHSMDADLEDDRNLSGGKPMPDQFQDALFLSGDRLHIDFISAKNR